MHCLSRFTLATSALVLAAPAAFAELSAEDIWKDWRTYIEGIGYGVNWQEKRTSDTLTLTGVTISGGDDGIGGATVTLDQIVMTERSDGTVAIDLPALMPMEVSAPNESGMTRVSLDYRQDGLEIVASGNPNALRYDYDAQEISLETTGVEVNGEILSADSNKIDIAFENLSGSTDMMIEGQRRYTQDLKVASVRYAVKTSDQDTSTSSDISGQVQALTFTGQSSLPNRKVEEGDVDAMLAAGFSADGRFSYGANANSVSVTAPSGPAEISSTSGIGELGVAIDQGGLTYDASQDNINVEVSSPQFPLPMSFAIAKSGFNLSMPIRKSQEAEDFAFGFLVNGFTVPETLWGMFDPGTQLPRDPANIALNVVGKAKLFFNFLNPETATMLTPETVPAEIESLEIQNLNVSFLGADLSGDGAFTFETAADGTPQPEGYVNLILTGANALIDKLIATGLLPEQQATGARMMMGLFAVPSGTPDTLNSKIEINTQGQIMANGQRIK